MSIESRINKLEKSLKVNDPEPPMMIIHAPSDLATIPHFPEPVEDWLLYQEESAKSKPLVFVADPVTEYELRHGLERGTLRGHPLCGRVAFDELLAAATGQRDMEE